MSDLTSTSIPYPFHSSVGAHADPVQPGGIYTGVIKYVGISRTATKRTNIGKVTIFIEHLGTTHKYVDALRGPETLPYVKGDKVLCVFLDNKMDTPMVIGRYNRLPINRMVGINVEEPEYPVHLGGQTTQYGVTLKIDPTSYSGSNRASIQMHETIMGAGSVTADEGDWYVFDNSNSKWNLYHTGHSDTTTGSLTVKSTGLSERFLQFLPAYIYGGVEWSAIFRDNANANMLINATVRSYDNIPYVSATYKLGSASIEWSQIYLVNNPIVSSDQNYKTDIVDSNLGLDFVNALRPVSFKLAHTDGREGVRTHYGLIAQEVESVLGADASDTAIWTKETIEASPEIPADEHLPGQPAVEGHEKQGLRYDELIAPLIKAVQELTARVEALEG